MNAHQRPWDAALTDTVHGQAVSGRPERDPTHPVDSTWRLSLHALAQQGLTSSTTLLRVLSCWSSAPVPMSLLSTHAMQDGLCGKLDPPLNAGGVEPALRGLQDHSLVSLVSLVATEGGQEARPSITTHEVVLKGVWAAAPEDQRPRLVMAAAQLLGRNLPDQWDAGASYLVGLMVPHAAALLERISDAETALSVVEVATRLAGYAFEGGDYHASLHLAEAAAHAAENWLGRDDQATLRAKHHTAMGLFRLGRFEESERVHRQVLNIRQRVLGPEHPETLESQQDIHEPLAQLQRPHEAVHALRVTEEVRSRLLGDLHPATLHTRALLIEYLATTDDAEAFQRLGPATVAACEEIVGIGSATTVTAHHNYAFGLFHFGRLEEAEPVARMAVEGRENLHGANHPLALSAAVLLSWVLRGLGALTEAANLARRVVDRQELSLGAEHPYVLVNRTELASTLAMAGAAAEAKELARHNLPLCDRVLGADHPATVETRRLIE
ncbi:tetratricopeptide repeat protein [Streptomyces chryseus]